MNLMEGLLNELERCNELHAEYIAIGPAGAFGAHFIRSEIELAKKRIATGDTIGMMKSYEALKECN